MHHNMKKLCNFMNLKVTNTINGIMIITRPQVKKLQIHSSISF